jgi:hypothetical protein
MSNLDILWMRSTATDLAKQIVQESISKIDTATATKKRRAEKEWEKEWEKK